MNGMSLGRGSKRNKTFEVRVIFWRLFMLSKSSFPIKENGKQRRKSLVMRVTIFC
jgi:hypothetical protein